MTQTPIEKIESRGEGDAVCIVVMGVSGTGKSTLGTALSLSLGLPYIEGDDLHPPANIAKMSAGVPLDDEDREPWLREIRGRVVGVVAGQVKAEAEEDGKGEDGEKGEKEGKEKLKGAIVGCSSLKRYYRDILRGLPATKPENGESLRDASPSSPSSSIPSLPSPSPNPSPNPLASSPTPTPKIHTYFAFISGPAPLLHARMQARPGHFMKASMLDSQLAVLEDPTLTGEEGVVRVSMEDATGVQVQGVREGLGAFGWDL